MSEKLRKENLAKAHGKRQFSSFPRFSGGIASEMKKKSREGSKFLKVILRMEGIRRGNMECVNKPVQAVQSLSLGNKHMCLLLDHNTKNKEARKFGWWKGREIRD
jgi:hypothetical protein